MVASSIDPKAAAWIASNSRISAVLREQPGHCCCANNLGTAKAPVLRTWYAPRVRQQRCCFRSSAENEPTTVGTALTPGVASIPATVGSLRP